MSSLKDNAFRNASKATELQVNKQPKNTSLQRVHDAKQAERLRMLRSDARQSAANSSKTPSSTALSKLKPVTFIVYWKVNNFKVYFFPFFVPSLAFNDTWQGTIPYASLEFDGNLKMSEVIPHLLTCAKDVYCKSLATRGFTILSFKL